MISLTVQMILFTLPWPLRRRLLSKLLGFKLAPTSFVGYSLILVKEVVLEDGARIKNLTLIKGLDLLHISQHGRLGNLNWVSAFPSGTGSVHFSEQVRHPQLLIGEHASITNRHLIDCTDSVKVGSFSTIAGFRSQLLTHSIDLRHSIQRCNPIEIGSYCFVGTGSILLGGSQLPDYSVLGAGSLLNKKHLETYMLYAGTPARKVAPLEAEYAYFHRTCGSVN